MAKRANRSNSPGVAATAALEAAGAEAQLPEPQAQSAGAVSSGQRPTIRPTEEQIRLRAFLIYQARKGGPGSAAEDWRRAEQELLAELNR